MQIENYKETENQEKVYATFDVNLGIKWGVTYPNLKLIRGKNGGFFIGLPSYLQHDDGMGNKTYGKYPKFTPEKWKDFSNEVMTLLKPKMEMF